MKKKNSLSFIDSKSFQSFKNEDEIKSHHVKFKQNDDELKSHHTMVKTSYQNSTSNYSPRKKAKQKSRAIGRDYNFLKIPPDWQLAKIHAQSRETKPEIGDENCIQEICQCCGYEIDRKDIGLNVDLLELGFLGPGYPLFYNYLKTCVIMLIFLFLIQGIPNVIINSKGNFCTSTELEAFEHSEKQKKHPSKRFVEYCVNNSVVKYSLANIINEEDHSSFALWSLIAMTIQLIITINFRKQQKDMDNIIDDANVTPADYSIFVENIPQDLENPKESIKRIFEEQAVPGQQVNVSKVVLVYDIKELLLLEEEVEEQIKEKQKILSKHFDLNNEEIHEIDNRIRYLHSQIRYLEKEIESNPQKFSGRAIISFRTEAEKQLVIDNNETNNYKRFINYFNNGISERYNNSLYVNNRHLYIQQAPEPAEIDWEYIHATTKEKLVARTLANIATFILTMFSFTVIALLSYLQALMTDHAYEELFEQQLHNKSKEKVVDSQSQIIYIKAISVVISLFIVVFNKFCLPFLIHQIADREKWSTKTKLNISFAIKLTLSLFTNTALITFFVEIIFFKNYYGIGGGMILGEYLVFINNAIIPALAWIIDPWSIVKNYKRRKELAKGDKSTLTQKEANELMEHPDYAMGKRYADVMKTMWFTFFYSPAIPLATVWSIVGIILYYWADKYNLIYRRTVKENIGKGLTIEMIEMIEYCILLHCFGNCFFKYQLFQFIDIYNIIMFVVAFVVSMLPMQDFNDYIFKPEAQQENDVYENVQMFFDSDYDRENPITKQKALKQYFTQRSATRFQMQTQQIITKEDLQ